MIPRKAWAGRNAGFSLIMVVVAASLMAIVAAGTMQMMSMFNRASRHVQSMGDTSNVNGSIQYVIGNAQICACNLTTSPNDPNAASSGYISFNPMLIGTATPPVISLSQLGLYNVTSGCPSSSVPTSVIISTGTTGMSAQLGIPLDTIQFTNLAPSTASTYTANLTLGYDLTKNVDKMQAMQNVSFPMVLTTTTVGPNQVNITGCTGGAGGGWGASGGVPSGAVMAFHLASCPTGWNPYPIAAGSMVVASGAGYPVTGTGGSTTHTLTAAELPPHTHTYWYVDGYGAFGSASWSAWFISGSPQPGNVTLGPNTNSQTAATGGGQPFSIMPPFVALLYCVKS